MESKSTDMKRDRNRGRIAAETPPDANCFIGFHDIIPWSADNSCLAIHRLDPSYFQVRDCDKPIEICLWTPETGEIAKLDASTAWNFQQGARLQWLPGRTDTLAFNTIEDGRPVAVLRNVLTGQRRVLPAPMYVLSSDGKSSIAPNFTTLAHRWRAYGYTPLLANAPIQDPAQDGLMHLDLETGEERLFISTKRVVEHDSGGEHDFSKHFLSHPSFSPDGSRLLFFDRFFLADGGLISRMFVTDREGKDLVMLTKEKSSHFDWIDNDTILIWSRFAGGLARARLRGMFGLSLSVPLARAARRFTGGWKQKLLSEAYHTIPISDPTKRRRFGWPSLTRDGHPMVARSHPWVVTDYYASNGVVPLFLFNQQSQVCVEVQSFRNQPRSTDPDVKCDLHPRWDRSERFVAVDTCEAGYRQVRIIDVDGIVTENDKRAGHRG